MTFVVWFIFEPFTYISCELFLNEKGETEGRVYNWTLLLKIEIFGIRRIKTQSD